MKNGKITWGVLGAGGILNRWIKGAMQVSGSEIAAVASRTRESAEAAARTYGIPEALSYEELLARGDIDAVYVAVPHTAHRDLALAAMRAGKAVLVEKPACVTAEDWDLLAACAKQEDVFLMEAVWTRFFPLIPEVARIIDSGEIGEVRMLQSAFSFRVGEGATAETTRLLDPDRAGGGLLDVGVYNLHFAEMILGGKPEAVTGLSALRREDGTVFTSGSAGANACCEGDPGESGDISHGSQPSRLVDDLAGYVAGYKGGALAVMTSGVGANIPDTATIFGTLGRIVMPVFWKPTSAEIISPAGTRTIARPVPQRVPGIEDEGYQFEIEHVNDCLREGIKESPVMMWEKTRQVLETCDELRRSWGLLYPFEEAD